MHICYLFNVWTRIRGSFLYLRANITVPSWFCSGSSSTLSVLPPAAWFLQRLPRQRRNLQRSVCVLLTWMHMCVKAGLLDECKKESVYEIYLYCHIFHFGGRFFLLIFSFPSQLTSNFCATVSVSAKHCQLSNTCVGVLESTRRKSYSTIWGEFSEHAATAFSAAFSEVA